MAFGTRLVTSGVLPLKMIGARNRFVVLNPLARVNGNGLVVWNADGESGGWFGGEWFVSVADVGD